MTHLPTSEGFAPRKISIRKTAKPAQGRRWLRDWLCHAKVRELTAVLAGNPADPSKITLTSLTVLKAGEKNRIDLLSPSAVKADPDLASIPAKVRHRLQEFLVAIPPRDIKGVPEGELPLEGPVWNVVWKPSFKTPQIILSGGDWKKKTRARISETVEYTDQGPHEIPGKALSPKTRLVLEIREELVQYLKSRFLGSPTAGTDSHLESLAVLADYLDPVTPLAWFRNGKAPKPGQRPQAVWNQFSPRFRSFHHIRYFDRGDGPNWQVGEPRIGHGHWGWCSMTEEKFFHVPPVGSPEQAAMILKRVLEYDWPVDPREVRKICNSTGTRKFIAGLESRLHKALQELIREVHPESALLAICMKIPHIDTDVAMQLMRENPALVRIAEDYPNVFTAFLPEDPDRDAGDWYDFYTTKILRTQLSGNRKQITDKELFQAFFSDNYRSGIPGSRYQAYLTAMHQMRSTSGKRNDRHHNCTIASEYAEPGKQCQADLLALDSEYLPQDSLEWKWLNKYFTFDRDAELWRKGEYRGGEYSPAQEHLEPVDGWIHFITKVRAKTRGRKIPSADSLTDAESDRFKKEAVLLKFTCRRMKDFQEVLHKTGQEIRMGLNQRSMLDPDHQSWGEEFNSVRKKVSALPVEKQIQLVRKWNRYAPLLVRCLADGVEILREANPEEAHEIDRFHPEARWWSLCRQWQILGQVLPEIPKIRSRLHPKGMTAIPKPPEALKSVDRPREEVDWNDHDWKNYYTIRRILRNLETSSLLEIDTGITVPEIQRNLREMEVTLVRICRNPVKFQVPDRLGTWRKYDLVFEAKKRIREERSITVRQRKVLEGLPALAGSLVGKFLDNHDLTPELECFLENSEEVAARISDPSFQTERRF